MKNYSIVVTRQVWEALRPWVQNNGISCEPSACGEDVYLSVTCTPEQAERVNRILDSLEG